MNSPQVEQVLSQFAVPWSGIDPQTLTPPLQNPFTYYMHIPKTGGRTLQSILVKSYSLSNIFHVPGDRDDYTQLFHSLPPKVRARIRVLIGHIPLSADIVSLIGQPFLLFTMLRDPVERTISHYHFLLKHDKHPLHEFIRKNNISLMDFVTRRDVFKGQNLLLNYLSGDPTGSAAGVEQAIHNLRERITFFGFMEEYDTLLVLMQKLMGLQDITYTKVNENASKKRTPLSGEEMAVMREACKHDLAIYEKAKEIYAQRMQALSPDFHSDVQTFRALNHPDSFYLAGINHFCEK